MLIFLLSLNLFIPPYEHLYLKTGLESKIDKYFSSGMIDSAEYYAQKLLNTSKDQKTKRKALLYLYRIYKTSGNEKEAYNALQKILKESGHFDSLTLYRDYFTYLYNSNKLNQIIELKDKIPSDDTLYFIMGLTLFKLNKLDTALTFLTKCRLKEALYLRAFSLYKLGNYSEAESLSKGLNWGELTLLTFSQKELWDSIVSYMEEKNIALNEKLLPYFRVLYIVALKKTGRKVPFTYYKEWLTTNKGHQLEDYVSFLYAEDLADQGEWSTAIEALNSIDTVKFFSKFPSFKGEYFWIKGKAFFYRGSNLINITKHLLQASNLIQDPMIKDSCNYLLGLTYSKFALYKKAVLYFQRVREDSNLYLDASFNLITAYYQLSQYDDALEIIEKVLKKRDLPVELKLNLLTIKTKIHEAQKDYSKAITTYQTMLLYETRKPEIYKIYYNIEMLKYKKGDYESLEKAYYSYISKFPDSPYVPQLYYDLLLKYIYSKDTDNARKALNALIDKFPEDSKTLDAIDLYFSSQIATLEDTTILKELLSKNPDIEDYVYLTLGRFYKRLRLYDVALKSLSTVKQGTYYNQAQVEIMEIYFLLNKYNEVEMLGIEIMPDEIKEYTSYRILELVLKAVKNEGKVLTFNSLVNRYANKDFPFKKDFCLMVSDIYIKEKDTTNAVKFLRMARDLGATDQEIANYNVELLKLSREIVR